VPGVIATAADGDVPKCRPNVDCALGEYDDVTDGGGVDCIAVAVEEKSHPNTTTVPIVVLTATRPGSRGFQVTSMIIIAQFDEKMSASSVGA
jgi:hypothetical protein